MAWKRHCIRQMSQTFLNVERIFLILAAFTLYLSLVFCSYCFYYYYLHVPFNVVFNLTFISLVIHLITYKLISWNYAFYVKGILRVENNVSLSWRQIFLCNIVRNLSSTWKSLKLLLQLLGSIGKLQQSTKAILFQLTKIYFDSSLHFCIVHLHSILFDGIVTFLMMHKYSNRFLFNLYVIFSCVS